MQEGFQRADAIPVTRHTVSEYWRSSSTFKQMYCNGMLIRAIFFVTLNSALHRESLAQAFLAQLAHKFFGLIASSSCKIQLTFKRNQYNSDGLCCTICSSPKALLTDMLSPLCSEISCNVKWNVYLAMEIPDRVSFVSGQNSDEIVRSHELSWRFF